MGNSAVILPFRSATAPASLDRDLAGTPPGVLADPPASSSVMTSTAEADIRRHIDGLKCSESVRAIDRRIETLVTVLALCLGILTAAVVVAIGAFIGDLR